MNSQDNQDLIYDEMMQRQSAATKAFKWNRCQFILNGRIIETIPMTHNTKYSRKIKKRLKKDGRIFTKI